MNTVSANTVSANTVYDLLGKTVNTHSLTRRTSSKNEVELKNVCEDFESLFVKMMLDAMRSSLSEETLIPKNSGEKIFEDQLYSEYSKKISHTANLGIAEMMYNQLQMALPVKAVDIQG